MIFWHAERFLIVTFDMQNAFYRTHPALVTENHKIDEEENQIHS